jgi:hypothetical protein
VPKRRTNGVAQELPEFDRNVARAMIPFGPVGAPAAILAQKVKLRDGRSLIGALQRLQADGIAVRLANRGWALAEKHHDRILALCGPAQSRRSPPQPKAQTAVRTDSSISSRARTPY